MKIYYEKWHIDKDILLSLKDDQREEAPKLYRTIVGKTAIINVTNFIMGFLTLGIVFPAIMLISSMFKRIPPDVAAGCWICLGICLPTYILLFVFTELIKKSILKNLNDFYDKYI